MTTAQLRDAAYEARKACKWNEAAALYEQAASAYPTAGFSLSKLAEADVKNLRKQAAFCRAAVDPELACATHGQYGYCTVCLFEKGGE